MVKGREEGVATSAVGPEQMAQKLPCESQQEDFPDGPGAKTPVPNSGGPGWIPGQGTRPHTLQLRVCMPQLRILCDANKAWHSQTNIIKDENGWMKIYLNIDNFL